MLHVYVPHVVAKCATSADTTRANLGKTDNGVVSVSTLWADESVSYPLQYRPYTPASHVAQGKADPQFRTKLQIAAELVAQARASGLPCRAVVADSFDGDDEPLRAAVRAHGVGSVFALKPSHCWWRREGTIGSLQEALDEAPWAGPEEPGAWVVVERSFRDGHRETWWVLDIVAGPYGPETPQRALVVTTDPRTRPPRSTWYLVTNLPAPGTAQATRSTLLAADVTEIVRLYGVRMWVEQSYKQTRYALGWSDYQVRSDLAMRRHWALVCCAFSFCWSHQSQQGVAACAPAGEDPGGLPRVAAAGAPDPAASAGRGKISAALPPCGPCSAGRWPYGRCAPGWSPGSCSGATGAGGRARPRHPPSACCLTGCGRGTASLSMSAHDHPRSQQSTVRSRSDHPARTSRRRGTGRVVRCPRGSWRRERTRGRARRRRLHRWLHSPNTLLCSQWASGQNEGRVGGCG